MQYYSIVWDKYWNLYIHFGVVNLDAIPVLCILLLPCYCWYRLPYCYHLGEVVRLIMMMLIHWLNMFVHTLDSWMFGNKSDSILVMLRRTCVRLLFYPLTNLVHLYFLGVVVCSFVVSAERRREERL